MPAAIIPGNVPADALAAAVADAITILNNVYSTCLPSDPSSLALVQKYYAAHLLYIQGFALPKINSSVGDVSSSKGGGVNMGDKVGNSPYFIEIEKLLECDDDFLVSV